MRKSERVFRRILCHNENHFIPVQWGGKIYPLCTRCTGVLAGFLLSIPLVIYFGAYQAPGKLIFLTGLALALPDYLYWGLTRVDLVPDWIPLRVLNGFLLGIGITLVGQAQINWFIKGLISLGMFLPGLILNPILGKRKPAIQLPTKE